jgi:hypothetical protein
VSYLCRIANQVFQRPCRQCEDPKRCESKLPPSIIRAGREIKAEVATLDLATFQPVFRTIKQVPIVMAGVEYQLSTGPATFTPEDVQDFVASQDDPAIVPPRLKIGHTSVLSSNEAMGILKNGDDGAPALGKVVDIWYDEDQMAAIGDYVGVPGWLAGIMPIAYPNRSIEGFQEAQTVTGHTWGLVVHAVALLGVVWPGVSTLEDLPWLYGETPPPGLEVVDQDGQEVDVTAVAASRRRPAEAATPVAAAVNVDDVRRAYYAQLDSAQYWWWIRAIYIDPNELIVDDDEGQLYRVGFTINGEEVEFQDPAEVRIQYVDAANSPQSRSLRAALSTALAAEPARIAASFTSREESRITANEEDNSMTREQRIAALRARLGLTAEQLPDNATDAQLNAAVLASTDTPAEPGEPSPTPATTDPNVEIPEPEEPEEPGPAGSPSEPGGEPTNASLPEGMVAVPASTWAEVQRNAAAGAEVAQTAQRNTDESEISAALRDGKIRPAEVPSYRNMYATAATREIAHRMLTASVEEGGLMPNLVPVAERGEAPAANGGPGGSETVDASYDESWLNPQERSRIHAVKGGTHTPERVQTDDPRLTARHAA